MDAQHERRLIALAAVAAILAGCASGQHAEPSPSTWSFADTAGGMHAREGANATVLFFMATWCGSCKQKAPVLSAAHEEWHPQGVRFLSLDFDPSETKEDLAAWMDQEDQPWPHGIDAGLRIQRLYDVTTQSTVLVLDAEGVIIERFGYGELDAQALDAAIARALAPVSSPTFA